MTFVLSAYSDRNTPCRSESMTPPNTALEPTAAPLLRSTVAGVRERAVRAFALPAAVAQLGPVSLLAR